MRQSQFKPFLFVLLGALMVLACEMSVGTGGVVESPTSIPLPTKVALATETPLPTNTARPIAVATPTATPPPTVTATPTEKEDNGPFGPITFAAAVASDDSPLDLTDTFPPSVSIVYGAFSFKGMKDGQLYRSEWRRDGKLQTDLITDKPWNGGASGNWWVSVYDDKGLTPGEWELNVYLDNKLQQSARMTIEANPTDAPSLGPITFASGIDTNGKPLNPIKVENPIFPAGTKEVYGFFDGKQINTALEWGSQWFHDGEQYTTESTSKWDPTKDPNAWARLYDTSGSALPAGAYELKLTLEGRPVALGTFYVAK